MRIPINKNIIVSVISDVVTDQRVQKECNTLYNMGYDLLVIGRKSRNNFMLDEFPYKVIRFNNLFSRGPLMYMVFNLQLFFYLLFKKADILWANDLDTLLPNFIIAGLKKKILIYDSHEYFTLAVHKRTSRKVWERLERFLFPKLKNVITVNDSIKKVYEEKYKVPVTVIRNVPAGNKSIDTVKIPQDHNQKKILVMQGRGINKDRGAEEAVQMMQYLPEEFILYFLGGGTVIEDIKKLVLEMNLSHRIFFMGILPYAEMMGYTRHGFAGLVLEKININDAHRFSLSNRFFDYIKANIPVLSTKGTHIKALIEKYNIGTFLDNVEPKGIADKIIDMASDKELYDTWKKNTVIAAQELRWENEEGILIEFMKNIK